MSLKSRFQALTGGQTTQPQNSWDVINTDYLDTEYGGGGTIWPKDWYLGKNIGLDRWEAFKVLPGVGGAAATILAGRASNGAAAAELPTQSTQTTTTDYTPFLIGGVVLVAAVMIAKN